MSFETSQRTSSTRAQKVTAIAAVVIAVLIFGGYVLFGALLNGVGRGIDRTLTSISGADNPRAVQQAICLPYSDFVLRQHQSGLSVEQIQGALDFAGRDGDGNPLDSAEICGSPQSVLDAALIGR